jgi:hypothetical protein
MAAKCRAGRLVLWEQERSRGPRSLRRPKAVFLLTKGGVGKRKRGAIGSQGKEMTEFELPCTLDDTAVEWTSKRYVESCRYEADIPLYDPASGAVVASPTESVYRAERRSRAQSTRIVHM